MSSMFGGNGLSREQLQSKAKAGAYVNQFDGSSNQGLVDRLRGRSPMPDPAACAWSGDPKETERDDLAHPHVVSSKQRTPRPQGSCKWPGDEPNYPRDDLGGACEPQAVDVQEGNHLPENPIPAFPAIVLPVPEMQSIDGPDLPAGDGDDGHKKKQHYLHEKHPEHHEKHHHKHSQKEPVPVPLAPVAPLAPVEAQPHSPWQGTFDQVNKGVKQGLGAVTAMLTTSPRNRSPPPDLAAEEPVAPDKREARRQKRKERHDARRQRHKEHQEARQQKKQVKSAERERRRQEKIEVRDQKQKERHVKKQQAFLS
ncbi:hypothetical protein GGR57DRAFT_496285 [Xylariaceae sp. FL1272]|nr:hypothetical protein GGR57DRAFT_496285 [Xylariaceae sp. FL1272]